MKFFKSILLLSLMSTLATSAFAQTEDICAYFKKQIEQKTEQLAKLEEQLPPLEEELATTLNELSEIQAKYSLRKKIWIPVSAVGGIVTIYTAVQAIRGLTSGSSLGHGLGTLGAIVATVLGTGTYFATRPISVSKKQLDAVIEALNQVESNVATVKTEIEKIEESLVEKELIYQHSCQ